MRRTFALFLMLFATCSSARSLHWPIVKVEASLDDNGFLHVIETQTFDFDGDWNGGERIFNIRSGQTLKLEGMDKVDGHATSPLVAGNLDLVDRYQLVNGTTLRWRSRQATDPPFEHAIRTYRIRYVLQGVLVGQGGKYELAHDFAFPSRTGQIERFVLDFTIDKAWSGLAEQHLERSSLAPGDSVIVRDTLEYHGATAPSGVFLRQANWLGWTNLALLCVGIGVLALRFVQGEYRLGRIGQLKPVSEVDDAWLLSNVFLYPPEVIGAAWDGQVGPAEVAAIIASMQQDGIIATKIDSSSANEPKLTMTLLQDRGAVSGYRGQLLKKLFFNNRTTTDTHALKKNYRKRGLDLPKALESGVKEELAQLPGWVDVMQPVNWQRNLRILVAAFLVLVLGGVFGGPQSGDLAMGMGLVGSFSLAIGSLLASSNSRDIHLLYVRFSWMAVLLAPVVFGYGYFAYWAQDFHFSMIELGAGLIWTLAVVRHVLDVLKSDEHPKKVAFRRNLLAARNYLKHQLDQSAPKLQDSWYPYLIAFGLGKSVDRWFSAFGSTGANNTEFQLSAPEARTSTRSTSAGSSDGVGWTGAGGAFGGAGASGSWAAAAGAISTAVISSSGSSSGSSSSSSSSSGGSSSSSGGGGGGGW